MASGGSTVAQMRYQFAIAHSLHRVALPAVALAIMLASGCGGDDDATTQSQRASTAAATSPSTSPDTAPAAASSSSPASQPSRPPTRNCPITASEVSQRIGVKLHAIPALFDTKVTCSFGAVDDCPCGSPKYSEVRVFISAGHPRTVSMERAINKKSGGLVDQPDLGKHAFVVQIPSLRGRSAIFPSSEGTASVGLLLGVRNKSNRAYAARDARNANRVILLVKSRLS